MSNWDYWRGTFEAAQAQAQVAASQASKFAEVVSAQVRTHMHLSTPICRMPMAAMFTNTGPVPESARPLTSSCCQRVVAELLHHATNFQCFRNSTLTIN